MNRAYRLIFNRALGVTQVTGENVRTQGKANGGSKRIGISPSRNHCLAALIALTLGGVALPAMAIDVTSEADWSSAVAAVAAAGAGSTVSINVTNGFTLTSSLTQLQASSTGVTVNITGNSQTINGASAFQGIQISGVNTPTVNISNLVIADTKAVGGNGGNGQNGYYSSSVAYGSGGGGGGGLGAGGGLFVGSGANVTLATVTFTGNTATGGNGGSGGSAQNVTSAVTGNGGDGGTLNGAGTTGGGGSGGTGGNTGTQGTVGAAGTALGAGGGGGGGSGVTSGGYSSNNSGGISTTSGGTGGPGGDGATNYQGNGAGADGGAGGMGGSGQGGAIYVANGASLTILDAPITSSTVTGGTGGSGGTGQGPNSLAGATGATGGAQGAGIYLGGVTANIGVTSGTLVYGDTIGGAGLTSSGVTTALNKTGTGVLVLAATNTFTGNVNITAGTLSIASAGNLGVGAASVVMSSGSTLAVTSTATFSSARTFKLAGLSTFDIASGTVSTFQGVVSDGASSGSLIKTNTGKLILSGANTYTGQTLVNAGTLALTGSSSLAHTSAVGVASGATLDLSAIASQSISALSGAGTVALGSRTLTSDTTNLGSDTLTLQGSLVNTGTVNTSVLGNSSYGKLTATGNVQLGGTLAVNVIGNPALSGSLLSIIHGDAGITGTFAQVTDNSVLFDFTPVYRANDVDLTVISSAANTANGSTSTTVTSVVRGFGNTPTFAAARVLDANFATAPNGDLAALFRPLTTTAQVNSAVTQTLPLLTGGASTAITGALSSINNVVQARQESYSGLSSGEITNDRHAWIKPFGSWANQGGSGGVSGYDANTTGLALGTDAAFTDRLRLGVAFAYGKTDVDSHSSNAPQSLQVDTYQLVGYGSYSLQPDTELNFQVDAGQHNNEGKRHIPFAGTSAKSDYSSQSAHAGVGLGHALHFSQQLTFVPSVRADYTWIGNEGYHEKGAGALDLNVNRQNTEQFILSTDGKVNYQFGQRTVISANLGAGYDLINDRASIASTYAGASDATFTTRGLDRSPWLKRGGLGVTQTLRNGTEVSLRYDVESRSDFLNQSAALKVRWAF